MGWGEGRGEEGEREKTSDGRCWWQRNKTFLRPLSRENLQIVIYTWK
jgi:hypothetical protein